MCLEGDCGGGGTQVNLVLRWRQDLGPWKGTVLRRTRPHHSEEDGGLARLRNKIGWLSGPPSEQPGNYLPWTVLGEFH